MQASKRSGEEEARSVKVFVFGALFCFLSFF